MLEFGHADGRGDQTGFCRACNAVWHSARVPIRMIAVPAECGGANGKRADVPVSSEDNNPMRRRSRLQVSAVRALVAASLAWTLWNWRGLTQVTNRLHDAAAFAGALIVTETLFVVGAVVAVIALGHTTFAGIGANPSKWLVGWKSARAYRDRSQEIARSRLFRFGFMMNWAGALGTGIVAFVGIIVVLPSTAWGLLVFPILDIAATVGWRIPVHARIKGARS